MQSSSFIKRIRRHRRVRARIVGTASRPRLSVARSNKRMYVQLIDDGAGKTVCGIASRVVAAQKGSNQKKTADAFLLGKAIAEKAKQQGIVSVVFDRSGYTYHGRVKAVADGAREGGLQF